MLRTPTHKPTHTPTHMPQRTHATKTVPFAWLVHEAWQIRTVRILAHMAPCSDLSIEAEMSEYHLVRSPTRHQSKDTTSNHTVLSFVVHHPEILTSRVCLLCRSSHLTSILSKGIQSPRPWQQQHRQRPLLTEQHQPPHMYHHARHPLPPPHPAAVRARQAATCCHHTACRPRSERCSNHKKARIMQRMARVI